MSFKGHVTCELVVREDRKHACMCACMRAGGRACVCVCVFEQQAQKFLITNIYLLM